MHIRRAAASFDTEIGVVDSEIVTMDTEIGVVDSEIADRV